MLGVKQILLCGSSQKMICCQAQIAFFSLQTVLLHKELFNTSLRQFCMAYVVCRKLMWNQLIRTCAKSSLKSLCQCSRSCSTIYTHRPFYTQTLVTHAHFYTKTLFHTKTFTHRSFHTHLYTSSFTHKHVKRLLHTNPRTHKRFDTQKLLHRKLLKHRAVYTQTLDTQILVHTNAFTHLHVDAQTLLHTKMLQTHPFTHEPFHTHRNTLRHRSVCTQAIDHITKRLQTDTVSQPLRRKRCDTLQNRNFT